MLTNLLIYVLVYTVTNVYGNNDNVADVCERPGEDKIGQCVKIGDCREVYSLLETKSEKNLNLLRELQCGFQGVHPKVCCRSEDDKPIFNYSLPSRTPDVQHGHLCNLLPNTTECGIFIEERVTEEASLDGYPWMALLEYNTPKKEGEVHCGGVLINKRYILTAAHCIPPKTVKEDRKLVGVRLGEYDITTNPDCDEYLYSAYNCCCTDPAINFGIEEIIIHPGYSYTDNNGYSDIALIRLDGDVEFTVFVRPICLQPLSLYANKTDPGSSSIIGGWGYTRKGHYSIKKLWTKLKIIANEECTTRTGFQLRHDQLCAVPRKGGNSCSGDNGGIIMNDKQETITILNYIGLGVMSKTYSDCSKDNSVVIYTRIQDYLPWIAKSLRH